MKRLSLVIIGLALLALPLSASQFVQISFDQVARESAYVVRGTVEHTWSQWDDSHEVIFTYATVRVDRYFGETTGPDTLTVREVGGTVESHVIPVITPKTRVASTLGGSDTKIAIEIARVR